MIHVDQEYSREVECEYKGERYRVRDNGAILRLPREGKPKRPKDNIWTFGEKIDRGYAKFCSESVHRIVAVAFLGEPPTKQHVVDHMDTNRQNNRPENLRWLTKLENILLNPITKAKIEYLCGSVESFLADPSQLRGHESDDSNFTWMRAVTAEEASNTLANWERLLNKTRPENKTNSKAIEEWIFQQNPDKKKQDIFADIDFDKIVVPSTIPESIPEVISEKASEIEVPVLPKPEKVSRRKKKVDNRIKKTKTVKITAVDVLFAEVECYFCHAPHSVFFVRYFVDETGKKYDEMNVDYELNRSNIPDLRFGDEILELVKDFIDSHPEKGIVMGEVKERYSKTRDENYMSFGCPKCDGLVGDWFLNDLWMELVYETDEEKMNRIQLKTPFEITVEEWIEKE